MQRVLRFIYWTIVARRKQQGSRRHVTHASNEHHEACAAARVGDRRNGDRKNTDSWSDALGVSVEFLVNGHLLGLPTSHVQAF
jgi:hypothetical protein